MSKRTVHRLILVGYLITDYIALLGSFIVGYVVRRQSDLVSSLDLVEVPVLNFAFRDFIKIAPWIGLLWLVAFLFTNRYQSVRRRRGFEEMYSILVGSSAGLLATMILTFFLGAQLFSRLIMFYAWAASILIIFVMRQLLHLVEAWLIKKGIGVDHVLLVGMSGTSRQFLEGVRQRGWPGYQIVGFLDNEFEDGRDEIQRGAPIINGRSGFVADVPFWGDTSTLDEKLRETEIDQVVIGLSGQQDDYISQVVESCEQCGVNYRFLPRLLSLVASYTVIDAVNGIPLLGIKGTKLRGLWLLAKRLFDLVVGVFLLIVLSPIFVFVAIGVKLSSPGPIVYKQERIGKDGKHFFVYKFRSMRHRSEQQTGRTWTVEDDERRTRFGSFIRRTNLDELPQFVNVVKGEMSLVGPRPEQPQFVEEFRKQIPRYSQRHRIQVGLTGWAQVNGWRGNTSIAERVQYDLYYIENWSPWLDLKIIFQTIGTLIRTKGAY